MTAATALSPDAGDSWPERCFDLLRGASVLTGSALLMRLARAVSIHPDAELSIAFNHRQVASKMWARHQLTEAGMGRLNRVWILGGWYGVLAALLFEESRLDIGQITSFDIDPAVAPVAVILNETEGRKNRFHAVTRDMYQLDYSGPSAPDLVINTSCEHIADLPGWLGLIPRGTRVLLQSNDYFSEAQHINSMSSLDAFASAAGLGEIAFAGALDLRKYTRFMLIGRV